MRFSIVSLVVSSVVMPLAAYPAAIQGYRAVELGAGTARITTDASGNSVVVGSAGDTAYAFPHASNRVSTDLSQSFPATPIDYSAASPVYHNDVFRNAAGEIVAAISFTVHAAGPNGADVPILQLDAYRTQADGSIGRIDRLFATPIYGGGDPAISPFANYISDFNNQGQLVFRGLPDGSGRASYMMMDIRVPGSLTNLDAILHAAIPGDTDVVKSVAGLDEQGRILAYVGPTSGGSLSSRPILLIPNGLSDGVPTPSDPTPTPTPVPEPSSALVLIAGILAAVRARRRGFPSRAGSR